MIGKKVKLVNGVSVLVLDKVLTLDKAISWAVAVDMYLIQVLEGGKIGNIRVVLPTSIKEILPDGE